MKSFPAMLSSRCALGFLSISLLLVPAVGARAQKGEDEVTPTVQRLYAEANEASQSGDQTGAIEKYRAILKLAPHLAAAYNNLGVLYFNQHDFAHASEVLKRGLELNGDMPTASAMLGMSYVQLGEDQKGEPLLRKALRANPKDDQVEMMLSRVLINAAKLDEAALHLNHFL